MVLTQITEGGGHTEDQVRTLLEEEYKLLCLGDYLKGQFDGWVKECGSKARAIKVPGELPSSLSEWSRLLIRLSRSLFFQLQRFGSWHIGDADWEENLALQSLYRNTLTPMREVRPDDIQVHRQ